MIDAALKQYFGFSEFRPLQREIVEAAMAGHDVFALMPTGAGKSLCFQLPAAMLPGITLVISPLIALMKDQVDALNATGIPATFLNSSLEGREQSARIQGLRDGKYKLLYVAPERFPSLGFLDFLSSLTVSLCVVDEAHCISEWGHDFRVDYRNLRILRERFPTAPIMAVTATATDRVASDIISQLHLRDPQLFRASFDRKNLIYQVWPKRSAKAQIVGYLSRRKGESGIIYCLSRDGAADMASMLQAEGHKAVAYHAGLEKERRAKAQDQFDRDEVDIVCATIAFGMGIDKPNVRYVIHHDLPKSIPAYYQETGRAGRDGLNSDCILFYGTGDRQKYARFFDEKPPDERARAFEELDKLVDLAETRECRRKALLGYFGEEYTNDNCGSCDNCASTQHIEEFDGTRIAQMFLSCVVRAKEDFSATHIIAVLLGQDTDRILSFRHHQLSTFGVGKDYSKQEWAHFVSEFRRLGLIKIDYNAFNRISVTHAGWDVLKNGRSVTLARPQKRERDRNRLERAAVDLPEGNRALFEELRALRRKLAEEMSVPPYVIFNDYTLKEFAGKLPTDGEAFRAISGVGEQKARQYGVDFLAAIRKFKERHPEMTVLQSVRHAPRVDRAPDSAQVTLAHLRSGLTPQQIAGELGKAVSTVNTHIAALISIGQISTLEGLVPDDKLPAIRKAFAKHGYAALTPVKEQLGDDYTYEELRFVRAFDERNAN